VARDSLLVLKSSGSYVQDRQRARARGRVFPVGGLTRAGLSPLLFNLFPFLFLADLGNL
jgi:hypothetical protein